VPQWIATALRAFWREHVVQEQWQMPSTALRTHHILEDAHRIDRRAVHRAKEGAGRVRADREEREVDGAQAAADLLEGRADGARLVDLVRLLVDSGVAWG
jgi:hypothetical protein